MTSRRARLIAKLTPWVEQRPQYRLSCGHGPLDLKYLTDEALELLASRIASDWWFTRRLNRANREIARRHHVNHFAGREAA